MVGESDINRRLRNVEDRLQSVWERVETTAALVSKKTKEHEDVLAALGRVQESAKGELAAIKTELSGIRRELGRFASAEKVAEIEGYLGFIDPMKFVTREEVRNIINEGSSSRKFFKEGETGKAEGD